LKVQLVCQFGQPIRGLSPYGDPLLEALKRASPDTVEAVDFKAAYPGFLHPAVRGGIAGHGELHWGNPASWFRVAGRSADVIHLQHWSAPLSSYYLAIAVSARRRGKVVAVSVHNPEHHESVPGLSALEGRFLKSVDALVVHEKRAVDILRMRLGKACPPLYVIPHGVQLHSDRENHSIDGYRRLGLDPVRRYVVMFGNLRGYKGVSVLLDAWMRVAKTFDDVDLVIAGRLWDGRTRAGARLASWLLGGRNSEDLKEQLSLVEATNRVHLREGFIPDEEIDFLLDMAQLAVFPYERFASQSGAACRAAGRGCPVLVTDVGGLPELAIDSSWVVEPSCSIALSSALAEKLSTNGEHRQPLRQSQRARVGAMRWSEVARDHLDLYAELLRTRRRKH